MNRLSFLVLTLFAAYCLCDDDAVNIEQVLPLQYPGGEIIMDRNNPKYLVLADESLEEYLRKSGSKEDYKVFKMIQVTYQVVTGTITRIIFTAMPLKCSTVSDGEKCDADKSAILICNSKITEQRWAHYRDLDVNCYGN